MTDAPVVAEFAARLDAAIQPPASELVRAYFKTDGVFAAHTFDTIGVNDPYRITTDDLLAVTLLNVWVPPKAVRRLLGQEAGTLSELLLPVPVDLPLWEATVTHLSAAEAVWDALCDQRGIDWVTAGKLLARKRPRLIPVFDSVIQDALRPTPGAFWTTLREALGDERRRMAIETLRPPGLTARVTTLRLLDVAVWMRNSAGTNARQVRQELGI